MLEESIGLLHRAIECGALVDPWNILGFGGQYSLFPSPENSVYDHRIDELIDMVSSIFTVDVQIQKEAAAVGVDGPGGAGFAAVGRAGRLVGQVRHDRGRLGREHFRPRDPRVGRARGRGPAGLARGGGGLGDLAFWREQAEQFRSPKAYALVVDTLLEQRNPVAAMALLVQWLSQAEEIPLAEEDYSFHDLALDWMEDLWDDFDERRTPAGRRTPPQRWALARKFLDYLEANAEEYWEVPRFELARDEAAGSEEEDEEVDDLSAPPTKA